MDIKLLYRRFSQLTWQQQLGNLASTLSRISSHAEKSDSDALVKTSLREAALFIEWSAPNVPATFLPELAAMQREMLAWQQSWPIQEARKLLSLHTRHQSDRLVQMAALLQAIDQPDKTLETVEAIG